MDSKAADRNVRLFMLFRIFFGARFYYPVLAVLFIDLGLSMEEYTLLNAAWAAAIVLFEVPSGALADRVGRKALVVGAMVLMILEMALLGFVPFGNHTVLFVCVLLNRILSGVAEASASGADEALAFDSLAAVGREKEWPLVLERLMRYQSIAFIVASLVGAAVYDPHFLNKAAGWVGWNLALEQAQTVRFPIYLTFGMAVLGLLTTLRMTEPLHVRKDNEPREGVKQTWLHILTTGKWLLGTPLALCLIVAAVLQDSVVRLFLTVESSYFRLADVPVVYYGPIGSVFALLGFLTATPARLMTLNLSPWRNILCQSLMIIVGLFGVGFIRNPWGVLFIIPLGTAFFLSSYLLSHHLNRLVESSRRATALSFRGVSINVAYGMVGILFAGLVASLREGEGAAANDAAFGAGLRVLPFVYLAGFVLVALLWAAKRPGLGEPAAKDTQRESQG